MHAVDIQAHRRIIHILRNVNLSHARQPADARRQFLRQAVDPRGKSGLLTCTSMGAGIPIFRMASTIEPLWKNVRKSGKALRDFRLNPVHIIETADVL